MLLSQNDIQAAKSVDIHKILNHFNWEVKGYLTRCPRDSHYDKTPSASCNSNNTVHCYVCRETYDSIALFRHLSQKVYGVDVPFREAVSEILLLDGLKPTTSSTGAIQPHKKQSGANGDIFNRVLYNCRPLQGYELNYLHSRGIFVYDSYVFQGKVYTVKSIEDALQTENTPQKIQELEKIKDQGTFYQGIAPILKANRIEIKHNYWQGVNSIIYLISYDYDSDEQLQSQAHFMADTSRKMMVGKSLDAEHKKMALGNTDFCFITEGMKQKGDIYICEGMEDAITYIMNGQKSISLNSTANVNSLIEFLEHNHARFKGNRLIISLDHDDTGREATQKLIDFFEDYNNRHPNHKYQYDVCIYPEEYHDINDYWKAKVFQTK